MQMLCQLLEEKYVLYNRPEFIEHDPVSIPHLFARKENIEISGFLTATISWGQRKTIINNARNLMSLMDHDPYSYIMDVTEHEISQLKFSHRTFNSVDLRFFILSLRNIYQHYGGLEQVFNEVYRKTNDVAECLKRFRGLFFEIPHESRTEKHIADIHKNASAKRLNLFLRWMIRKDNAGVDFGIWNEIPASALYIPLDVHTGNISRKLGLLSRKQNDWKAVVELTDRLRKLDAADPVKYDYALFGMGANEDRVEEE